MTENVKQEHQFTSSWRWTESFESWVESLVTGYSINVCAGLCPIGDVRVDIMSPLEIIELLGNDENTSLSEAREVLEDLLTGGFVGRDVVQELYAADDPTGHNLAKYIDDQGWVQADVFSEEGLPFGDNTFEWTISDPPWKELPDADRERLFDELTRITEPGGHILFNAWWVPTNSAVTLDHIRFRQDNDRYDMGTPNLSYASVYTVHSSPHTARYRSQTFTNREFAPEPSTLKEAIEAETAYRLEAVEGVPHEAYDIRAVGPDSTQRCPHCGNTRLDIATGAAGFNVPDDERLYQCPSCEYPVSEAELEAIEDGQIQMVRYENGWSSIPPSELQEVDPRNPPEELVERLSDEPGLSEGSVTEYLEFAVESEQNTGIGGVHPQNHTRSSGQKVS
jgi:SAM-dependent methyltransferase